MTDIPIVTFYNKIIHAARINGRNYIGDHSPNSLSATT